MIEGLVGSRRRPLSQPVEEIPMTSYRCARLAVVAVTLAMQAALRPRSAPARPT